MAQNQIVHIADVHIRFHSRHDEYRTVLKRVVDDVRTIKPRRIALLGDLFHIKINLSPTAIEIAGDFLRDLSEIAPVDIILGNHDLNMQSLAQGDAISPLINLLPNAYTLTNENPKLPIPDNHKHGVYFYKDSGFYEVDDKITYAVYSCWDNKLLPPIDKSKDKNHRTIALFHGAIYGATSDNGYEMKNDDLVKLSMFKNYDITMLGDLHEFQSFEMSGVERIAYSGSILQNSFGESLNKGFLVWDLNSCTFERRFVPNECGFSKMIITKGEIWEDRVADLQFSMDKKKTKIEIIIQDDKENYSVEKLSQIEKYIRSMHGCLNVSVDFEEVERVLEEGEKIKNSDDIDINDSESAEKLLVEFLDQNGYENVDDVIELSREIDRKLNIQQPTTHGKRIEFTSMEVSNLLSFGVEPTFFDFDKLKGICGIFGENYNGKSNVMKVFTWILYGKTPGDDAKAPKLVNMYTGINKGWGRIHFNIAGTKFYAYRAVTVKSNKKGVAEVSYNIEYKKESQVLNELTNETELKWINVESEEAATEKKEKKKLITDYISTYDNFMMTAIQNNKSDYLSLSQQPKNQLVSKFLGLEVYQERYEYGNETFKSIKSQQKLLGNPLEIEAEIAVLQTKLIESETLLETLQKEKGENNSSIEKINEKIIVLTKKLHKIELPKENDKNKIDAKIKNLNSSIETNKKNLKEKEDWLKANFKRELPESLKNLDKNIIEKELNNEKEAFSKEVTLFKSTELWIKENPVKETPSQEPTEVKIANIRAALATLDGKLKITKGEKCPTCNHVSHEADPIAEKKCLEDIERGEKALKEAKEELSKMKLDVEHNAKVSRETSKIDSWKISMPARKSKIETLKTNLELCSQKEEIVSHNKIVDEKSNSVTDLKSSIDKNEKEIIVLEGDIELIEKNEKFVIENEKTNNLVLTEKDEIKTYQIMNLQVDTKLKACSGEIGANKNNIEVLTEKLNTIRETDRIYKKYSIYLQATGRDGIPKMIISRKLPIINHKINSLLKDMVSFKVELSIKTNGDVEESFYFSDNKSDILPISMGSGSIKFLTSTAISDALYYVSSLIKVSIKIIDEGLDTLDNKKLLEVNNVFNYLKSRYKNVFIITHKAEVRDFVDYIIEVKKTKEGITDPDALANPEAGISQFIYS